MYLSREGLLRSPLDNYHEFVIIVQVSKKIGPKRFHPVPVNMEDLPELDAIIISHNHYDHLDKASIKKLDHKTKTYFVPLAVGKYLEGWGINPQKIIELDWWQGVEHDEVQFIATPALHFSGRGIFDHNESFWNSWVIKLKRIRFSFAAIPACSRFLKIVGMHFTQPGTICCAKGECCSFKRLPVSFDGYLWIVGLLAQS
jgi:L-ascorbate metabolism protein UlaG (beta-lactamase superfamily)